ncbi:MAG: FHA domain-containing protein [Kineosporiaceae bacterium]|nr:FHA domain-containing protein [Kineosporiaceae bacterium]
MRELHVVCGPGAGTRVPVGTTRLTIGRSPGCEIALDDPEVSWRHAEVLVAPVVAVRDLFSANGSELHGRSLGASPEPWADGAVLTVGSTRIVLRDHPDSPRARVSTDDRGRRLVHRAPRLSSPVESLVLDQPAPPAEPPAARLPWVAATITALAMVPLAVLARQPLFLVMAVVGPLALLAQHLLDRRARRREHRRALDRHAGLCRTVEDRVVAAREVEAASARARHPDPVQLAHDLVGIAGQDPGARLWERSAGDLDQLHLRLGLGEAPSRITVRRSRTGADAADPASAATESHLIDVPITLDLARVRVLGICGPAQRRQALARSLFGQLATLCSPAEVRLTGPPAGPWGWLGRLPHAALATDPAPTGGRAGDAKGEGEGHGAGTRVSVRLAEGDGIPPQPGDHLVVLAERRQDLPRACRAVIELPTSPEEQAVVDEHDRPPRRFRPDLPPAVWAEALADGLTGLHDADADAAARQGIASTVRLLDLVSTDPARIAADWLAQLHGPGSPELATSTGEPWAERLSAPLGRTRDGVWCPDLVGEGPHALVAGTTGAGKSEFLISLVASLATRHPPERLAFLLVDFKGGTAFGPVRDLPHVVGVVTDLDAAGSRRAISSLFAELRRRERLAAEAACASTLDEPILDQVQGSLPPPRLVIVVDEFRVLAEQHPDLLAALVRVATVGRGLGVHLVLATQRPAGVVSGEIRANTALRVALRLRERSDSEDVIESPDAAALHPDRPGRALVRRGGEDLRQVQIAHLPDGDRRVALTAIRAAATLVGSRPAPPPWLPELPHRLAGEDLRAAEGAGEGAIPFALADLPDEQRREVVSWDGTHGHLAVVGGPGSGRSTVLRTLAAAAGPDRSVHVIDPSGRLAALQHLPRVGTVLTSRDPDRAARLVELLTRDGRGALLLIDGWDELWQNWSREDPAVLEDVLHLARYASADGVRLVVTGGRALMSGPMSALIGEHLVLAATDPTIALLAGLPAAPARPAVPGRGLLVRQGRMVEVQVALPRRTPPGPPHHPGPPDHPSPPGPLDPSLPGPGSPPMRLRELPDRHDLSELMRDRPGWPPAMVPLGIGGDHALPVGLPRQVPGALICGPPGSGRSTALATLACVLPELGRPVVLLAPTPLPWPGGEGVVVIAGRDGAAEALRTALTRHPEATLLLDTGWAGLAGVEELACRHLGGEVSPGAGWGGLRVVAAGEAPEAAMALRGLVSQLRALRCGLLLGRRSPGDGAALGSVVRGCSAAPAGRGMLVVGTSRTTVQVATPSSGSTALG